MKVEYRSQFVAPSGKLLVTCDLSQAESWVVAHLANEKNMKYALMYSDIHCQGAGATLILNGCPHDWVKGENRCKLCNVVLLKDQRYLGKRYNHASSYGLGPDKAMRVINADSDKPPFVTITLRESQELSKNWHSFYNVKGWWEDVRSKDRTMTTSYGFTRTFYGQWGDELEREKIAFEPQSTVADHFNGAIHPEVGQPGGLIEIYKQLVKPYFCGNIFCAHKDCHKIINQSHDSFIAEFPSGVAKEIGLKAMELLKRPIVIKDESFIIPSDGLIGERWQESEMEKLTLKTQ